MEKLSGYYWFMDNLRAEKNLLFWCQCGVSTDVKDHMPLRMFCFCGRRMIVMDKEDKP